MIKSRQKLGLSQAELASIMGVHVMTISKWERGDRNPGNAAIRFVEILGWLFDNEPEIFYKATKLN